MTDMSKRKKPKIYGFGTAKQNRANIDVVIAEIEAMCSFPKPHSEVVEAVALLSSTYYDGSTEEERTLIEGYTQALLWSLGVSEITDAQGASHENPVGLLLRKIKYENAIDLKIVKPDEESKTTKPLSQ